MSNLPSSAAKNKAVHKSFFSEAIFSSMEVFTYKGSGLKVTHSNQNGIKTNHSHYLNKIWTMSSTSDVKIEYFQRHSLKTWSLLPFEILSLQSIFRFFQGLWKLIIGRFALKIPPLPKYLFFRGVTNYPFMYALLFKLFGKLLEIKIWTIKMLLKNFACNWGIPFATIG